MIKNNNTLDSSLTDQVDSSTLSRRKFIKILATGVTALSIPLISGNAMARTMPVNRPKVVWVLLRGALDSLHTIVPSFDAHYKIARPKLATSFDSPLLPLSQGFNLHPALKNMHQWYQEKAMSPIVAVSSGYPQRSHFDGQDFLETGKDNIDYDSGWLARAIDIKNKQALAIAHSTPISLRSSEQVNTWYPSNLANADEDIYSALLTMYQGDELLKNSLEHGLEIKGLIAKNKKRKSKFIDLNAACAQLMIGEKGVDCAMLELGGWDTHNNQGSRLNKKLTELDQGLAQLKLGLGKEWQNTVVIVGTEFGRTVKENGTGGTDHGTGSALFLCGGAVNGGTVLGTWPGLKKEQLFAGRDLQPTTNSFAWIGNVLAQHWGLTEPELQQVFPHIDVYQQPLLTSRDG